MLNQHRPRRGVSLLELLAVVTLMGILSSVVMARYGRDVFGNVGARAAAQELTGQLQIAQQLAIKTGINHSVEFAGTSSGGFGTATIVSWAGNGKSGTPVSDPYAFPSDVTVTSSSTGIQFNFEGQATAASTVTCSGKDRKWQVSVVPISGAITSAEVK